VIPYLSLVIAARNDNYGGDFMGRLQAFVRVLGWQVRNHGLPLELVIVEWNPPPDRPGLGQAVDWPEAIPPESVRIITVPNEIHLDTAGGDRMPMFEYFAKNVGLRRARGDFVLVTNPDVIMSDALVQVVAAGSLAEDAFYRIDRCDYRAGKLDEIEGSTADHYATRRLVRINIRQERRRGLSIRIGWMRRRLSLFSAGWPGTHQQIGVVAPASTAAVELADDTEFYGGIYTNASGDFILAARSRWSEIRGFPEYTETFTHLDSYACHQLTALGLRQMLFVPPCMLFHAEHSRSQQRARPRTASVVWKRELAEIRQGGLGPAINGPNWGLGDRSLDETRPLAGA